MEDKIFDILVIGGGPAGITAAIYAKRAGRDVAILEKFALGGQLNLIGLIENYPGFDKIDGANLALNFAKHAKSLDIPVISGEAVEYKLEGKIKEIVCRKNTYKARAIVIAIGNHSRELGIEGEQEFKGRGVSYCALCDGNFFKGRRVAVVGSGDSAFSDAEYLSSLCSQVYVLTKEKLKLHNYAENALDDKENVVILKGAISQKIEGDQSVEKLLYLKDEKTSEIQVDGIFVAIGRVPDTEKLKCFVKVDEKGYITADEKMNTSQAGVFVCGDVRKGNIQQISTAVGDGAIAGTEATKYVLLQKAQERKL